LRDEAAVRCEGIVRTYRTPSGEVQALRNVSAQLPAGVVTAVIGPSGSGKSSLLRLIAGIDRPSGGSVFVQGHEIGRASVHARRRLRRDVVAYVFQRPSANFLADLTVREHLRVAAGEGPGEEQLVAILDSLEIGHRADHLPSELSGGEQQRAAFAQALASGARIVVADEPTAELDSLSGAYILARLRALAREGVTFVIATHDPDVIAAAGHGIHLDHGRLREATSVPPRSREAATVHDGAALRWPQDDLPEWEEAYDPGPVVSLRDVTKTYGHGEEAVHAVRGVSLSASRGEIVGLVGRSGSGKTTLLSITAGWEPADGGAIATPGDGSPTWSDIAVVPQRLGLMDELSVRENVEYPARLAGGLHDRADLIDDLLEAFGLHGLSRRYPNEISLGEQQRTALARALVLRPRLLIADEPTGHQDAGWGRKIFDVLADAASLGTCCLVATHDRTLAPLMDRVISMADGALADPEADSEADPQ
jgi:putative ABC transport system ATP-binding protein